MKDFLEQDILLRTDVELLERMNQMQGLKIISKLQPMLVNPFQIRKDGNSRSHSRWVQVCCSVLLQQFPRWIQTGQD